MKIIDFELVFNTFQGHIILLDLDLRVVAISDGVVRSTMMSREEHIGRSVFDFFSSPNPADFVQSINRVMKTRSTDEMEIQRVMMFDKPTYWKPKTYPLINNNGEIEFLIHESIDVTSVIDKDIELSKHLTLRDIIDRQSDGFFILDKDNCFSFVNKTLEKFSALVGVDLVVGGKLNDLFNNPDAKKFSDRYQKVRETNEDIHFQDTYSGRILSVDAYPTLNQSVAVFFRDITDQIAAQKETKESREFLKFITDHVPAFVAYFDNEGRYQFFNRSYEEWFGFKSEDVIGIKRENFAAPDVADTAKEFADRALKGEYIRFDVAMEKAGQIHHFQTSYIPDIDIKGQVRGVVTISFEITDRVEALKLREDFMSIASHELKTPLTSLSLQSYYAKGRLKKNNGLTIEETQKFISSIDLSTKRLNRLIEDMLDITRISNGQLVLLFEKFDLVDLMSEILDRYSDMIDNISLNVSDNLIGTWDRHRIDQVVSNLINNAIKYAKDSPVHINVSRENEFAVIKIKDEGPGISPDAQKKIFQRFERQTSDSSINGLGLGLFICKEILERHDGNISVHSEPGKGAEFTVMLPLD